MIFNNLRSRIANPSSVIVASELPLAFTHNFSSFLYEVFPSPCNHIAIIATIFAGDFNQLFNFFHYVFIVFILTVQMYMIFFKDAYFFLTSV